MKKYYANYCCNGETLTDSIESNNMNQLAKAIKAIAEDCTPKSANYHWVVCETETTRPVLAGGRRFGKTYREEC